jgi:hypothetical protein
MFTVDSSGAPLVCEFFHNKRVAILKRSLSFVDYVKCLSIKKADRNGGLGITLLFLLPSVPITMCLCPIAHSLISL